MAENPIRRTTGKGGNYRKTKSGAGMTAKGVRAYRAANPGSKLKTAVTGKVKPGSKAAISVTSGGVDSMETYKYIIGQINALESVQQEISNLQQDKEQNEGTIINLNSKNNNTK
jgi:hypothetical protein